MVNNKQNEYRHSDWYCFFSSNSYILVMIKFLKAFLIFTLLYHILVTVVCYGFFGGQYPEIPALLRESIWVLFILIIVIANRRALISYTKTWKYPRIFFICVVLFGIGISRLQEKSFSDMVIGIKYGFWYLFVFLSTSVVGYLLAKKEQGEATPEDGWKKIISFLSFVFATILVVVVAGFVWQGLKLILPDWFLQIGYGPLNDFHFWDKPPLYYLTGLGGTLRWQWLFAGPNNYGYFLVAFLPVILYLVKDKMDILKWFRWWKRVKRCLWILRILAIMMTLSRAALVGTLVVVALVFSSWIRKYRKIALWILIVCLLGLVGLSLLKHTSTLAHITKTFGSLRAVINHPFGYGLGSSGPAVHHNGNMLPENYFIQLMLDIGTIGFLIWIFCVSQIGTITKAIKDDSTLIYQIWKWLTIGRIALLVMGIFLHVFEDSMVNYSFFIVRGITTWYLSYSLKEKSFGLWDFWRKK